MKSKINKVVYILGTVFAVLAIVTVVALCRPQGNTSAFTPPPFEVNAVSGVPDVPENLGYSSPYKEGMSYRFSVCGNVTTDGTDAIVYLTNLAENKVWLKVRLLDEKGNAIGESGLIKPGEYVKSIQLNSVPSEGTKIKLKIMGYEPETYSSAGSATLNTVMGGKTE